MPPLLLTACAITSASYPSGAPAKIVNLLIQFRAIALGGRATLAQPVIEIVVRNAEQLLEIVERGLIQRIHMRIGEGTEDQVHFLHTAMPCAESNALTPRFRGAFRDVVHDH